MMIVRKNEKVPFLSAFQALVSSDVVSSPIRRSSDEEEVILAAAAVVAREKESYDDPSFVKNQV